jgi:hypothetical protein
MMAVSLLMNSGVNRVPLSSQPHPAPTEVDLLVLDVTRDKWDFGELALAQ